MAYKGLGGAGDNLNKVRSFTQAQPTVDSERERVRARERRGGGPGIQVELFVYHRHTIVIIEFATWRLAFQ